MRVAIYLIFKSVKMCISVDVILAQYAVCCVQAIFYVCDCT